ncbi:MAG: carbohydrate ABC transporter permease [Acidimicrobiales bacterium]
MEKTIASTSEFGPLAGAVGTASATPGRRRKHRLRPAWEPYAFIAPFLLLFLGLYIIPIGYAIYQALYTKKQSGLGLGPGRTVFTGVSNFTSVFTSGTFWSGITTVLKFGIVQVPVMMILALILALLLDTALVRVRRFFRFAMFLPYAVPGVIAAILWAFLYFPSLSPLVPLIHQIPGLTQFSFFGNHVVLWSIANIVTWEWTGFAMLIYIAAMQSIPIELYEAARAEGASEWKIATRIKLPLITPAIGMSALFSIIGTLQLFNEPTVLRALTPNVTATYTPNMYAYAAAFSYDNYHLAAAVAVGLAAITFVFSFLLLSFLTKKQALQ